MQKQYFEKYSQDQFPLRDEFRALKAGVSMKLFGNLDNNDIYIKDGYAAKMEYPLNEESVIHAGQRFSYVYNKYLKDTNVKSYLSVIPDKNYFTASDGRRLQLNYDNLISLIRSETDFAEYIDIFGSLELSDYYRTDTHWRQENIIPAAEALASAMGTSIGSEFNENILDRDYYGVYYGQVSLPMESEKIVYLTNETIDNASVYDFQNGKEISAYDMKKGMAKDGYELFLSEPLSLISMENNTDKAGKELIIFRDSFGSSIASLLLTGYDKITLVDIRYMHPDMLSKFIELSIRTYCFYTALQS